MPSKFPCTVCRFNVHNNHRAIFCDSCLCHNWTHLGCTPFTRLEYSTMSKSSDEWYCSTCLTSIFPFNHFNNDIDFLFVLYDFNFQDDFDTELLKQKKFNPFFNDPETSHLLMSSILDPDANFFVANSQLLFTASIYPLQNLIKFHYFVLIHFPQFILIFVVYLNTLMTYQNFFLH